jgi:predicted hydrocarbon binding protein
MSHRGKLPNILFYITLSVCEDILGEKGLFSILKYTGLEKFIDEFPQQDLELTHNYEDFTTITTSMIEVLGEKGAASIMLEAGKRAFDLMLEVAPYLFNIEGIKPKKIPPGKEFEEFLKIFKVMTDAASNIFGDIYTIMEQEVGLIYEISPCYLCNGLRTKNAICYIQVGFMARAAEWIMGKEAVVKETLCIAKGDDRCRFVVVKPEA